MRTLFTDASYAEFGWELMSWQGYVRKVARAFDRVVVCTTKGLEPLYADFGSEFLVHTVPMIRDCFNRREIFDKNAWSEYQSQIADCYRRAQRDGEVKTLAATKYIPPDQQSFVCYGDAGRAKERGDVYDVVIHARNKRGGNSYYDIYNWPIEWWTKGVAALRDKGLRVAATGTKSSALAPANADDLRDLDLGRLMDLMSASTLIVGPSSGPMHLAALCGLPRLVWGTKKFSTSTQMDDRTRYNERWNPFKVPCMVVDDTQTPSVDRFISDVEAALTSMIPGAVSAQRMTNYWSDRRKQQGRSYVSYLGKNSDHQVDRLVPELKALLGDKKYEHGMDYGCGWGRFSGVILEHCKQLRCVDLISDFRNDLSRNVVFEKVGFPTKISVPDASIDLFVAITSLQHIVDEHWFRDVAREVRRILAPGAKIIIVDDNGKPGQHVKQRVAERFAQLLKFTVETKKLFSLDSPKSHHVVVGTHS